MVFTSPLHRCVWLAVAILVLALLPSMASAASWTVLVYLNADNDLEEYGMMDMNEMEAAPGNASVNVVVQMDRSPQFDNSDGNWTGARRYLITHDTNTHAISSQVLATLGPTDMGNPQTLVDFVKWGMETYPADHYLLDIWDHGDGWKASGVQIPWKGISYDYTSGNDISTTELGTALKQVASAEGRKLDIVATDACLMGMAEIGYEVKDGANYWLSSEETIPGFGFAYDQLLGGLDATPTMSPAALCQLAVQTYVDSYDTGGSQTGGWGAIPVCLSAVDLSKIGDVEAAVDTFAVALTNAMAAECTNITSAVWQTQFYADMDYRDLYDVASKMKSNVADTGLQSAADAVMAAVSGAVVANAYVDSSEAGSHGISIYYPEWDWYMSAYAGLAFIATTGNHWADFISTEPPCSGGSDDAYEPDNTPAQASTLISGHTQTNHWFSSEYDLDWVKVSMQSGWPYIIETRNLGDNCDTVMVLFDASILTNPDAVPLADNDDISYPDNVASRITYQPSASGDYYVAVMDFWGSMGPGTNYDLLFSQISFSDVPVDNWAFGEIEGCVSANVVQGFGDNTYHPTAPVTRDQMAVYTSRALAGGDANVPDPAAGTQTFTDVPNTGQGNDGTQPYWAYRYIEYAASRGIVTGYPDGSYKPTVAVDRGQMAVFIARAMADPVGDVGLAGYMPPATPTFPDVTSDGDYKWALKYVEYIAEKRVAGGYPDGSYHPERGVTRDQMAVYIARAFGLMN